MPSEYYRCKISLNYNVTWDNALSKAYIMIPFAVLAPSAKTATLRDCKEFTNLCKIFRYVSIDYRKCKIHFAAIQGNAVAHYEVEHGSDMLERFVEPEITTGNLSRCKDYQT